jgi:hypothetical protein
MAKILQKVFTSTDQVSQSFTVESWHVSQSIDAFTGADDYDITISGSLTVIGPTSGSFTGSLLGTSSWADNAVTALTASFVQNAQTASYVLNAQTASYVLNAVSSSFSSTASFVNPLNQNVILTGSLNTSGSVILRGLTTGPRAFVVTIDNTTGQLYFTSSAAIISGSITPAGSNTQIQYNNAGALGGVPTLTYNGTTLRATGSFTGSFTGNLTGTSSYATNALSANMAISAINRNGDFVIPTTSIFFQNTGTSVIYSSTTTNLPLQLYTTNPSSPAGMTFHRGGNYAVNMGIDTDNYFRIGGYSDGTFSRLSLSPTGELYIPRALIVGNISPSVAPGSIHASNDIVAFSTSDKRLKDNITLISNPIEKIQKIGGYEFDWIPTEDIHSYEGHDIGVIAQEIEEVLPELVQTRDNGYKAVKYDKIVALLIEAIKDQQKQIEELKSKIG